jgi:TatA/E family protein of Tat protein translocase
VFSVPDIMVVSVLALLLFGPDRLPKIMRQAGRFMREVQNTSQSFVAEMERAADVADEAEPPAYAAPVTVREVQGPPSPGAANPNDG